MGGMKTSQLIMFMVIEGRNTTSHFLFHQVFIFLVRNTFFFWQKLKWCWRKEGREGDINVFSGTSTFPAQVIFLSAGDGRPPQGQTTPPVSAGSPLS